MQCIESLPDSLEVTISPVSNFCGVILVRATLTKWIPSVIPRIYYYQTPSLHSSIRLHPTLPFRDSHIAPFCSHQFLLGNNTIYIFFNLSISHQKQLYPALWSSRMIPALGIMISKLQEVLGSIPSEARSCYTFVFVCEDASGTYCLWIYVG
jgi:hypothetical protein